MTGGLQGHESKEQKAENEEQIAEKEAQKAAEHEDRQVFVTLLRILLSALGSFLFRLCNPLLRDEAFSSRDWPQGVAFEGSGTTGSLS